ncbi:unnamed protein product, partial [Polarella glacialis]
DSGFLGNQPGVICAMEGKRSKVGRFLGAVCHWEFVESREQPAENKASLPESKKRKRRPEDPLPKSCDVHVEVELKGEITRGQTVVDWGTSCEGAERQRRVCWAEELDVEMFCQMLRETVAA